MNFMVKIGSGVGWQLLNNKSLFLCKYGQKTFRLPEEQTNVQKPLHSICTTKLIETNLKHFFFDFNQNLINFSE